VVHRAETIKASGKFSHYLRHLPERRNPSVILSS